MQTQIIIDEISSDCQRIVADPVHGRIILPKIINFLVDQPAFQRLRNIHQLGLAHFVYPSACHDRFQHCLGTFHLAKQWLDSLKTKGLKRKIEPVDEYCVWIAALYHDIGHGPFSHFWDGIFMPNESSKHSVKPIPHEQMSIQILRYLFESKPFESFRKEFNLNEELQLRKIEAMIDGKDIEEYVQGLPVEYRVDIPAEEKGKGFLYMIVSNHDVEIDVDKWDYLLRDSLYTSGTALEIPVLRFNEFISFKEENGKWKMTIPLKEYLNLTMILIQRHRLHRQVYQHKTCKAVEQMFYDALSLNEATGSTHFYETTVSGDVERFLQLDDSIFTDILHRGNEKSKKIMRSIYSRNLYQMIAQASIARDRFNPSKKLKKIEIEIAKKSGCSNDLFCLMKAKFDMAGRDPDPLRDLKVVTKDGNDMAENEVSSMIKINCQSEYEIRLYAKKVKKRLTRRKIDMLKKTFKKVFEDRHFRVMQ